MKPNPSKKTLFAWITGVLITAGLSANNVAYSVSAKVDTRGLSLVTTADVRLLDTRGYAVDWSTMHTLDTRKTKGTLVLIH
jgi:hypothetical protein